MTDSEFGKAIDQMVAGDREGLRIIYEEYVSYIYTVVYDVLKNRENAEDITTDFFIKLWNIASTYKGGNGHRGWMVRIAHNMSIDFLRKYRREDLTDMMEDASSENEGDSYGKSIYGGENKSQVEQQVISDMSFQEALELLNEKEKEVINMKVLGDMTFKEIAEVLDVPMGTITWRYQNALKKLRSLGYE